TSSGVSSVHGAGSNSGTSTIRVSSRPSTSTFVATKRLPRIGGPHRTRRVLHGQHDLRVCAATAQVARQRGANVRLLGRAVVVQQRDGGQNLARRAESALDGVPRDER